jgi:hypothetical protein
VLDTHSFLSEIFGPLKNPPQTRAHGRQDAKSAWHVLPELAESAGGQVWEVPKIGSDDALGG